MPVEVLFILWPFGVIAFVVWRILRKLEGVGVNHA